LVAELRRDIAYSRVQFSIAQVYSSVGYWCYSFRK
jgi:hypothetical protein